MILEFLGGAAFRMVWGEVSAFINKKLEHKQELERMETQERYQAAQHGRNLEAIRLQADMGIKTIEVQSQATLDQFDASAFLEGVKATAVKTGVRWVDAWNASIRPACASWALVMLTAEGFKWATLTDTVQSVASAALGLYLADRTLAKRGK